MKNAYIELDQLIRAWDAQQEQPLSVGQRSILVEIARRDADGLKTKISDITLQFRFGTGPTVHSYLCLLEEQGLIARAGSETDGRAVILSLTSKGRDYLSALSNLVRAAAKSK